MSSTGVRAVVVVVAMAVAATATLGSSSISIRGFLSLGSVTAAVKFCTAGSECCVRLSNVG